MNEVKILQIATGAWLSDDRKPMYNVMGLGDDNNIYQWNKKTADWSLWKSQPRKYVEDDDDIPY